MTFTKEEIMKLRFERDFILRLMEGVTYQRTTILATTVGIHADKVLRNLTLYFLSIGGDPVLYRQMLIKELGFIDHHISHVNDKIQ